MCLMGGWDGMLTVDSVRKMSQGDTSFQPVLQVLEMRRMASPNNTERWRLHVSDGQNFFSSMLATQMNAMVQSNELQNLCIVRLKDFIANTVQGRRVLVILSLEVVTGPHNMKIGAPLDINAAMQKPAAGVNVNTPVTPATSAPAQGPGQTPAVNGGFSSMSGVTTPTASAPVSSYNPEPKPYQPPASAQPWNGGGMNGGPIATVNSSVTGLTQNVKYHPIMGINPYQNRWIIRGRCSNRGGIRKYQNARGEGQVFSFELSDDSGSIKIACFHEMATKMSEMVQIGKLYSVTRANVKQADKRYNRCTSEYEMMLNNDSEILPCPEDATVAKIKYKFVKVAELEAKPEQTYHDVLAIVQEMSEVQELISRSDGSPLQKRSLTLVDETQKSISLTLWGDAARNLVAGLEGSHPVLLCRGVRRGSYLGGITLDGMRSSSFEVNPDLPDAHTLKGWYDAQGQMMTVTNVSSGGGSANDTERKPLQQMKDSESQLLTDDPSGVTFTSRATIAMIRNDRDLWYTACPETNKKVTSMLGGRWRCEATDKEYDHCNYRYVLSVNLQDDSSSQYVSMFDEAAQMILGTSAEEMNKLKEEGNEEEFARILDAPLLSTYTLRIRMKQEIYQDEKRIKYQVQRCAPLDFASESKLLLTEIKEYGF